MHAYTPFTISGCCLSDSPNIPPPVSGVSPAIATRNSPTLSPKTAGGDHLRRSASSPSPNSAADIAAALPYSASTFAFGPRFWIPLANASIGTYSSSHSIIRSGSVRT